MSESTAKRSSSPSSTSILTSSSSSASAASSASAVATRASSATSTSSKTPAPTGGWLAEKIHNNFLTCKLCFEVYTSPKCLSCLHTFCESCIDNLLHENDLLTAYRKYTTSDYREVVCPICRRRTPVPLGGVRRLPDNFLIEGLSETLIRQKPPKYPLCDICKHLGKTNKDASSKCLECQRLMCQECVLLHGQTKVTSGHTIFDVEIEKEVECKDHEDEVVRFYCDTCSACICVMCTFNEHRDHDILGFQEAALKHHGRVKNMADICKKNLNNSEKELEALESCESLMNSVEQFIKSKAEEMLNEVKFREKLLIEQLKKIYGKQCLERISKKKDLIIRMEECKSACKLVDAVLTGKEIEFLLLRTKVEQKLESLNKIPRKKLPATVGKVIEFRPGSLDFGHLYDYDNPRPLAKSSSLDKNNSLPDNDNDKAATKRKSKTAIEINYVTAYYGGGQIHTCSVDTQTDPVEIKVKSGEPFKVKKADKILDKKKAVVDDLSKDEQTTTTTTASTTSTTPTSQVSVARNENKSSTNQSSVQVVSAPPSSKQHGSKTTQKQAPTRPSSSSTSASSTVKGSSTSSTSSSSSSSMSSPQTQRSDKHLQSATKTPSKVTTSTTQQQSTAQQQQQHQQQQSTTQQQQKQSTPKLRRILKHLGSSVESFSSYDEDGGVFYQEEVPKIPSKESRRPLVSISSTSSLSSISSLPSPALNNIQPNLAPAAAASTAAVATAAKAAVGSSLDQKAKVEEKVSATSNVAASTPQSVSPLQKNLASSPASSTQHNVASASQIVSPPSQIVSTSKIVLQPGVQQASVTLPKTSTSVFRPTIPASPSATSSSSSLPSSSSASLPSSSSASLPSSSSPSLPSPSQGTLVMPSSTMKINNFGQNVVAETKLQSTQQSSNKPRSMAVVVKSSASSTNAPTSSSSAAATTSSSSSSSSLPSAQKSPPMTSSSPPSPVQTQSFALPTSKAQLITSPISLSSSSSSSLAKPNLASIPAQTITKVIAPNVASSKSSPAAAAASQPSPSSALQSSLPSSTSQPSSLPSSSSSSSSTSKPKVVPTTMQVTPSGGLKIVATVTPTLTSATKLTSSSSSSSSPSVTSLSQAVAPPSVEGDGKVEAEKSEVAAVAAASAAPTASTTSTATTATVSPAANEVVYRKRREKGDKEMTHLSDSPLFKHSYSVGETKHGATPSRHNSLFYPSYLRHSHVPPTSPFHPSSSSSSSSSGAPASSLHRMSDGSLYGHHKFF